MESGPVTCPYGHPIVDGAARFCLQCGAPLATAQAATSPTAACGVHPERTATLPCPRCGTFACNECLVRQPDGGELCLSCHARVDARLPWDQREELGTARAFWRTSRELLLRPRVTLLSAGSTGSVGSSLLFAVIANLIASVMTVGLYALLGVMVAAMSARDPLKGAGLTVAILLMAVVGAVAMGIGTTLVSAGMDHLVLRLSGAQPKGFAVTLRANAISLAPAVVALVPGCGVYAYGIWALVLRVFAYRDLHGISGGRAALGALALPGLLIGLVLIFYVIAFGAALLSSGMSG